MCKEMSVITVNRVAGKKTLVGHNGGPRRRRGPRDCEFGHLSADRTSSRVLSLVGQVLHGGRHEAVRAQQMALQALKHKSTLIFKKRGA
jgi:hypothetical protein